MGCSNSAMAAFERTIPIEWMDQFLALKLSRGDLRGLFGVFQAIDKDQGGSIDINELLGHLDIECTRFSRRTFSVFDTNRSGQIDLREFVLSLWNYCTLTQATLDIFAFDLYDIDDSGELSLHEVEKMIEDLYGPHFSHNPHARQICCELHAFKKRGSFDVEAFSKFARSHQQMMFPAFQMQLKLQECIMGRHFWEKCTARRVEWAKGEYISVDQLMEMHLKPELYDQLIDRQAFNANRMHDVAQPQTGLYVNTGTRHDRHVAAAEMLAQQEQEQQEQLRQRALTSLRKDKHDAMNEYKHEFAALPPERKAVKDLDRHQIVEAYFRTFPTKPGKTSSKSYSSHSSPSQHLEGNDSSGHAKRKKHGKHTEKADTLINLEDSGDAHTFLESNDFSGHSVQSIPRRRSEPTKERVSDKSTLPEGRTRSMSTSHSHSQSVDRFDRRATGKVVPVILNENKVNDLDHSLQLE